MTGFNYAKLADLWGGGSGPASERTQSTVVDNVSSSCSEATSECSSSCGSDDSDRSTASSGSSFLAGLLRSRRRRRLGDNGSTSEELIRHGPKKRRSRAWCRLFYWEEQRRVGEQLAVHAHAVDVFSGPGSLPKGAGMCLQETFKHNQKASERTMATRRKIGQGLLLSQDSLTSSVWAYNRSECDVFVNSPTLDPRNLDAVRKIPPGYSTRIFDFAALPRVAQRAPPDGPYDPYSVQISFVKGWGEGYTRQDVHRCPCWLQICLEPPR